MWAVAILTFQLLVCFSKIGTWSLDLANLGAVASDVGEEVSELAEITLLGHFSLSLSVDLVLCRFILFGIFFGCSIDSIVIAVDSLDGTGQTFHSIWLVIGKK